MSKQTTETIAAPKPIETDDEITKRLMQDVHFALCKLSEHYRRLKTKKQYEVNRCIHILWDL